MQENAPLGVEDAQIHRSCVQVDATVVLVLSGRSEEFHAKPPFIGFANGIPGARTGDLNEYQALGTDRAEHGSSSVRSAAGTHLNLMVNRAILFAVAFIMSVATCAASEGVILLHGLCRTERSMTKMASALEAQGYRVVNVDYPSRKTTIEELAAATIAAALDHPKLENLDKIHFVTHSMGGILIRQYLKTKKIERLGRVVMLGPPNSGSEVVDALGDNRLFALINGPAGKQLGTGSDSVPNRLGPVDFDLGVLAGDRSINWINSWIIDGPDDGKVSVARTRISGMTDHLAIHAVHPLLASNTLAIRETIYYLRNGTFKHSAE